MEAEKPVQGCWNDLVERRRSLVSGACSSPWEVARFRDV